MRELYRFREVRHADSERSFSFTLHAGEIKLMQLGSKIEKESMIDFAIGEAPCDSGMIEIIQGDRRRGNFSGNIPKSERRIKPDAVPFIWSSIQLNHAGRVGWVAANGGLISNLKVWENITLPLWYHAKRDAIETEKSLEHWLAILGIEPSACADFMASPPYSIESWQRKLAGLLRALVQMPRILVIDAGIFEDIKARMAQSWITALDLYVAQGRAVLVLADKATLLPWEKIE